MPRLSERLIDGSRALLDANNGGWKCVYGRGGTGTGALACLPGVREGSSSAESGGSHQAADVNNVILNVSGAWLGLALESLPRSRRSTGSDVARAKLRAQQASLGCPMRRDRVCSREFRRIWASLAGGDSSAMRACRGDMSFCSERQQPG